MNPKDPLTSRPPIRLRLLLDSSLGLEPFQVRHGVIDECHGVREYPVAGLLGYQPVHLLGDAAVDRVALRPASELDQVHRLAGVHVEHVAQAVGERERVRPRARGTPADRSR